MNPQLEKGCPLLPQLPGKHKSRFPLKEENTIKLFYHFTDDLQHLIKIKKELKTRRKRETAKENPQEVQLLELPDIIF